MILETIIDLLKSDRKQFILDRIGDAEIDQIKPKHYNLIAHTYKERRNIIGIASHYDTYKGVPGANDNGSAVAVTLELFRRFTENPTKHVGIDYFFFDLEENGLEGSRHYARTHDLTNLVGVYNMELVGRGDICAIWTVQDQDDGPLFNAYKKSCKQLGVPLIQVPAVVTNSADHVSFVRQGIESFSITRASDRDIEVLRRYQELIGKGIVGEELFRIMVLAPIFMDYHQMSDTPEKLDEESLRSTANTIECAIRLLDETH